MPITNEILERAYLTGDGEAMTESSECVQTNLAQERGGSHWYAAYTASCREKRVVEHLASRDIESFLPLYRSRRRWKNGCCVELERPLFPGYVFVRMARVERTRILEVPGVLSIVSRGRTPEALQDDTIAILRANHQLWRAEPHPYLVVGEHVLVHAGPFAGLSGIVLRHILRKGSASAHRGFQYRLDVKPGSSLEREGSVTSYRGKCLEPYAREELIEKLFAELLAQLRLDREVLDWAAEALRQSERHERSCQRIALARLQAQHDTLQSRIDAMYLDKLDGRIDAAFFDRKASEWRIEQNRLTREIQAHHEPGQHQDGGVRILELASKASELFLAQPARGKRRLLDFSVSNCSWKGGKLSATFRQPFDMLSDTIRIAQSENLPSARQPIDFEKWLPGLDSN